jgi:hypothetical protein
LTLTKKRPNQLGNWNCCAVSTEHVTVMEKCQSPSGLTQRRADRLPKGKLSTESQELREARFDVAGVAPAAGSTHRLQVRLA